MKNAQGKTIGTIVYDMEDVRNVWNPAVKQEQKESAISEQLQSKIKPRVLDYGQMQEVKFDIKDKEVEDFTEKMQLAELALVKANSVIDNQNQLLTQINKKFLSQKTTIGGILKTTKQNPSKSLISDCIDSPHKMIAFKELDSPGAKS